jgi:hypothetical protein
MDALVVSQVEAIVNSEHRLQSRYASLLEAPDKKEAQAWAIEVWNLRRRADRLERLLLAFDSTDSPSGAFAKTHHSVCRKSR